MRTRETEPGSADRTVESRLGRNVRRRHVLAFSLGFVLFAVLLAALLPVHITTSSFGGLLKVRSLTRLPLASPEFLANVLGLLPLLLVPSIIVNAGILLRHKRRGAGES